MLPERLTVAEMAETQVPEQNAPPGVPIGIGEQDLQPVVAGAAGDGHAGVHARLGRRQWGDVVARIEDRVGDEIESLLRAGRHQHVRGAAIDPARTADVRYEIA